MQTLKQCAMATIASIVVGGAGAANAADIPPEPGPPVYQRAAPRYAPPPVQEVYPDAPPPVVYRYAPPPPPVVYYDDPPPVVVYPPRYRYSHRGYYGPRYYGYHGYGPYGARGYAHRHWHR